MGVQTGTATPAPFRWRGPSTRTCGSARYARDTPAGLRSVENHPDITALVHVPLHEALRFGVNLVMYALTGNYKGDQVHVPQILQRLGQ